MKVNKKLLQQHLSERTGKVVTLRDITNVQAGCRKQSDKNNLDALVALLTAIDGKFLSNLSICLRNSFITFL